MWAKNTEKLGFTIVELLIVIVVIGVLAAVTIVAYSGVQRRASNTVIIESASGSLKMIQAYIAATGEYPFTTNACITSVSGCKVNGSVIGESSTFDTNIATLGKVPRSIPMDNSTNQSGILFTYNGSRTYDGNLQPGLLFYWLFGIGQQCGISGVVTGWATGLSSTTGYTVASDGSSGKTLCYITIPGPSA